MAIDPVVAAGVAAAALLVAFVAAVLALVALSRLRAERRRRPARPLDTAEDVVAVLDRTVEDVLHLRNDLGAVEEQTALLRERVATGLSRVGTVRYDAFEDMGGRLSFSTALLDEHGDGVVITSINGRAETRTYAKPITGGTSRHNLSEEEDQAIARAVGGAGRTGGDPDPELDEPTVPRNWVRPVAGAS